MFLTICQAYHKGKKLSANNLDLSNQDYLPSAIILQSNNCH